MTLPNDDLPKRDKENEESVSNGEQGQQDDSQQRGYAQPEETGDDEGAAGYEFSVVVGTSLGRKLIEQAEDEGLSVEEYMRELLAESVVFRAWELAERKIQMRGGNSQGNQQNQQHRGGNNNNNNNRNNKGRNRRGGMSHSRYQNIMDDKASFLEYVRNQERKNNNR